MSIQFDKNKFIQSLKDAKRANESEKLNILQDSVNILFNFPYHVPEFLPFIFDFHSDSSRAVKIYLLDLMEKIGKLSPSRKLLFRLNPSNTILVNPSFC